MFFFYLAYSPPTYAASVHIRATADTAPVHIHAPADTAPVHVHAPADTAPVHIHAPADTAPVHIHAPTDTAPGHVHAPTYLHRVYRILFLVHSSAVILVHISKHNSHFFAFRVSHLNVCISNGTR